MWLAGLFAVAVHASTAQAELVVNGSFEAPSIAPAPFDLFPAIPGWTPTAGLLELQRNGVVGPGVGFDGQQWLEIDRSAGATGIFQDLATVPGESYVLSFAYAPRPFESAADNVFSVLWGGATIAVFGPLAPPPGDAIDWRLASFLVTATGSSTRLHFNDLGAPFSVGALVDAVSVQKFPVQGVPEPSAVTLALVGVVGVIGCAMVAARTGERGTQ